MKKLTDTQTDTKNWPQLFCRKLRKSFPYQTFVSYLFEKIYRFAPRNGDRMELYAILLASEIKHAEADLNKDSLPIELHKEDKRLSVEVVMENLTASLQHLLGKKNVSLAMRYKNPASDNSGPFGAFGRHGGADL